MKKLSLIAVVGIFLLAGLAAQARAQVAYRMTEQEMKALLDRIETGADSFRKSLADFLDVSSYDDTRDEKNINQFIKEFEAATDHLRGRFDDDQSAAADVEEVLRRAARIDGFMLNNKPTPRAERDWTGLRRDLDQLAQAYNVAWSWEGLSNKPFRINDKEVRRLLDRLEQTADRYRSSLNSALDRTTFDGTNAEDNIQSFIKDFEQATDRLKDHFNKKQAAAADAEDVMKRAASIDSFMRRHALSPRAQEDWMTLRRNLDELAMAYGVTWQWMA